MVSDQICGTSDAIFTLRQLQEKALEQQESIYMAFIDLTKAFDSVDRSLLWKIMLRLGIPPTFVNVCRSLHTNNYARVRYNGELTEPFSTRTGVRQGCILAPLLFNLVTAALTMLVDRKLTVRGIGMRYRTDGGLFNLRRLRAFTKTRTRYICDLHYADEKY